MDEKIIYRLWRKYLAATRENTSAEWKKYVLACLRENILPPIAHGLDFTTFVGALPYNHIEDTRAVPGEDTRAVPGEDMQAVTVERMQEVK